MSPIAGGWSGEYVVDGFKCEARAAKPHGAVKQVVATLIANDISVDIPDIQYQLDVQWYARDPKRFIHPPVLPVAPKPAPKDDGNVEIEKVMNAICSFLNLSYRTSMTVEEFSGFMLELFKEDGDAGCTHCAAIVRGVAEKPGKDWRYEIQSKLMTHFGLPLKPKALIAKEWALR